MEFTQWTIDSRISSKCGTRLFAPYDEVPLLLHLILLGIGGGVQEALKWGEILKKKDLWTQTTTSGSLQSTVDSSSEKTHMNG